MKNFYNLKLFLLTLFVALAGTVSAETVTFVAGTDMGSSGTSNVSMSKSGITISVPSGTLSRTDNYRVYANSSITVSSEVGNITQVVFTCTSSNANLVVSDNVTKSGSVFTWTGDAESLTISNGSQTRITQIEVTYTASGSQKTFPNLSFNPASVTMTIGETFTAPTLNNEYGVAVTYQSTNTNVATVDPTTGEVTVLAAGTTDIEVTSEEDDDYEAGYAAYTLTVNKIDPALAFSEGSVQVNLGDDFTAPTLTNALGMTVSYESTNTGVATVDPTTGAVTIVGAGTTTITATSAEDATHSAGSASYNLTVLDANTH
ncbi:MAG: Ig-like domain-containing protein, partial [Bacteroidaceae bacterium]|nr:Ig-like domain-containing protein [Bacteroidaceae bacterium]